MINNRKKLFFLLAILMLSFMFVGCNEKKEDISVTISIEGPEDIGIILETTIVNVKEGETVINLLKNIAKDNKIHLDFTGSKSIAYVKGIDNIYEFDRGSESGWTYKVNNEVQNVSAGSYKLKDGDSIEWIYVIELGN